MAFCMANSSKGHLFSTLRLFVYNNTYNPHWYIGTCLPLVHTNVFVLCLHPKDNYWKKSCRKRSCQKSCQSLFSDHSSKTNTYFLCTFDINTSFPCLTKTCWHTWQKPHKRCCLNCKIENGSKFVSREGVQEDFRCLLQLSWNERRCRSITFTIARCHPIDELHWSNGGFFKPFYFAIFDLNLKPKKDLALSSARMRWHIWQSCCSKAMPIIVMNPCSTINAIKRSFRLEQF